MGAASNPTATGGMLYAQGPGATTTNGEFVLGTGTNQLVGPTKEYAYYIEVPAGATRLLVELFDPDVGRGGGTEDTAGRDRTRNSFGTTATYTLTNPSGTTVATLACTAAATPAACVDNAWGTLFDSTTGITAGHWKVSLTMNDDDINGYGLRASDGTSGAGGTEYPIYIDSFMGPGVNPPNTGNRTNTYTVYPYVTSGCTANKNDFDWNNSFGNTGNVVVTSRLGSFTQTFGTGTMSDAAVWSRSNFNNWTSVNTNDDYGIWTAAVGIRTFNNGGVNGNYGSFYFAAPTVGVNPPATNPYPDVFRLYLPTDAGGIPAKPYISQVARTKGKPYTPVVGTTSSVGVTVTVVNPTNSAITFDATHLLTVNVPGGGAVYGGLVGVSQGTVTAQPVWNGTGNITWNAGTVGAGNQVSLAYIVRATPPSAAVLPVTGTGTAGTKAFYIDETGNTTQTRAGYTFGPLCGLSVQAGVATAATVANVKANAIGGDVLITWDTASEADTIGFDVYREDDASGQYVHVNDKMLLGILDAPEGGSYKLVDRGGKVGHKYVVVETEPSGNKRVHGPFEVDGRGAPAAASTTTETFSRHMRRNASPRARLATAIRRTVPSGAIANVDVREEGLYAVTSRDLAPALGTSVLDVERRIRANQLTITNQGRAVPWMGETTGKTLYFYGEGIDSPYTLDNTYRVERGVGLQMPRTPVADANGALATSFWQSKHIEKDALAALAFAPDPEDDYWFWTYLYAGDAATGTRTFDFDVASKAPSIGQGITEEAAVTVYLHGATTTGVDGEHHVGVAVNGVSVGDSKFTGIAPLAATFKFSSALLHPGANELELVGVLDSGVSHSIVYVDSFDIAYAHDYASDGAVLDFRRTGAGAVAATGFANPNLRLLNVADPGHPSRIAGAKVRQDADGSYRLAFNQASGDGRYLAVAADHLHTPTRIRPDAGSTLRSIHNAAEHLIITTRDLHDAASALARHRRGQGLRSGVVDVEDIYDAFSFGKPTPWAIHDFLAYAHSYWGTAPRYVVLAGDGSYDYKDLLGQGRNALPPLLRSSEHGLFASDLSFVGSDETDKLDVAIGRIPAATPQELTSYVDKLVAYETAGAALPSSSNVLLLSGASGPGTAFATQSARLAGILGDSERVTRASTTEMTLADARAVLFREIANGSPVVNYFGHGGSDRLAAEGLFTVADVPSLSPPRGLNPFVSAMSCAVGRFELAGVQTLGETLVLNRNGAIAVWSPTGLSPDDQSEMLSTMFYQAATRNPAARVPVGDLIAQTLVRYRTAGGSQDMINIYNLLGDPATKLNITALPEQVAPPSGATPSGTLQ